MNRTATQPHVSPLSLRAAAFSLAALITAGVLSLLGQTADRHYDQATWARAECTTPTQVVVITGKRLPKA